MSTTTTTTTAERYAAAISRASLEDALTWESAEEQTLWALDYFAWFELYPFVSDPIFIRSQIDLENRLEALLA